MTIKLPKPAFTDRLLSFIGKKRAVRLPFEVYERVGPYVYAQAEKEPFWRALTRPNNQGPPEGWIYPDQIIPGENSKEVVMEDGEKINTINSKEKVRANKGNKNTNNQRNKTPMQTILICIVLVSLIGTGILVYVQYVSPQKKSKEQQAISGVTPADISNFPGEQKKEETASKRGSIKDAIKNDINAIISQHNLSPVDPDSINLIKVIRHISEDLFSTRTDADQKRGVISKLPNNHKVIFFVYNNFNTLDKDTFSNVNFILDSNTPAFVFHFYFDQYSMLSGSDEQLKKFKQIIENNKKSIKGIFLFGHTCNIGTDNYNVGLSVKRVQFIADKLSDTKLGMIAIACGEYYPTAPNNNAKNRAQNRRVDVILLTGEESQ